MARAGELRDWQKSLRDWVKANEACRLDILDRLGSSGPLTSREIPDTCEVPWTSTGWTNNQNVIRLLGFMVQRGEVATAGRKGRERLWDLATRVYPDDPVVPAEEALRILDERRLKLWASPAPSSEVPMEPNDVGEAGEPAVVEGVKGRGGSTPPCWDSRSRVGRRCSPRSTGWSTTAGARPSSSSSTTSWRCTSPLPSGAGATSRS